MAKHEELGVKHAKHVPGCVTRHVGTYIKGNTCSHRWQAAKRARAETRIQYTNPNGKGDIEWSDSAKNLATLAKYKLQGKIARAAKAVAGKLVAKLEPFATVWWPWKNNAHHIVPRSTLATTLEELASSAGDAKSGKVFDIMVQALLTEKYNLNGQPNMIMLPVLESDGVAMKLPAHLSGKKRDHPAYSRKVKGVVKWKLRPVYKALIDAVKAEKHSEKDKAPAARSILEEIANTTYDAIINRAAAARDANEADVTLDSIAATLYK